MTLLANAAVLLLLLAAPASGSVSDGSYICARSGLVTHGTLDQKHGLTLAAAQTWCLANASCAAFTFPSNATCAAEAGNATLIPTVDFKRGISR